MVVETRGLGAVKVFDVGMLGVGLSVGPCPGVADARDADRGEYLETGDLRRIDVGVRLAGTGIVGGEWRRNHVRKDSELESVLEAGSGGPLQ